MYSDKIFTPLPVPVPERPKFKLLPVEELYQINGFDEMLRRHIEQREKNGGSDPMFKENPNIKPVIVVRDGSYRSEESAGEVIYGGNITDHEASGLRVVSYSSDIGGVHVTGTASEFTLSDAVINLSGNSIGLGGRDSGVSVTDHGKLTIKNSVITCIGASRSASFASYHGVLKVYDSTLNTLGAPYGDDAPDGEYPGSYSPITGRRGNARGHCTVKNAWSYFYNSTITADGWAALSTDISDGFVYLEANDCNIITTKSGYGAYADFCCHDQFNRCRFDVASQAVVMAGNCTAELISCDIRCGTFLADLCSVNGTIADVCELTIKNTKAVSGGDCGILIRSTNAVVDISRSDIINQSGVLIQCKNNTDALATRTWGNEVYGVHIYLRNMDAQGAIIHEDTDRNMWLTMESASLHGAIHGAILQMDLSSRWYSNENSEVTFGSPIHVAQIDAPAGVVISALAGEESHYDLPSGGKLVIHQA